MEPILTVENLQKTYGGKGSHTKALRGLDLRVFPGEFVGIMGPSGSGKTTLLNCISTIDVPTAGSIRVDGTDLTALKGKALSRFRRERLGFIFQDCNLLDTLTGLENIALALTIGGAAPGTVESRAREAAQLLGVEEVLDKFPYQMSGGQQQRVGIARALVVKPKIIFADEPTGNLDSKTTMEVLALMRRIVQEQNQTLVMVTHDNHLATYADRQFHIVDGKIFKIEEQRHKPPDDEAGEGES